VGLGVALLFFLECKAVALVNVFFQGTIPSPSRLNIALPSFKTDGLWFKRVPPC